jgi:hypothetical protein
MDASDCLKEAEKCERLARGCAQAASRVFFLDAAAHWRDMVLRMESRQKQPPAPDTAVVRQEL